MANYLCIKRNEYFAKCWLAATNMKEFNRNVSKAEVESIVVPDLCKNILRRLESCQSNKDQFSLCLAAKLTYGTVCLYRMQVSNLYAEVVNLFCTPIQINIGESTQKRPNKMQNTQIRYKRRRIQVQLIEEIIEVNQQQEMMRDLQEMMRNFEEIDTNNIITAQLMEVDLMNTVRNTENTLKEHEELQAEIEEPEYGPMTNEEKEMFYMTEENRSNNAVSEQNTTEKQRLEHDHSISLQPNSETNVEAAGPLINGVLQNLHISTTQIIVEEMEVNCSLPNAEVNLNLIDPPIENITPTMPMLEMEPVSSKTKLNTKRQKGLIWDKTIEFSVQQCEKYQNESIVTMRCMDPKQDTVKGKHLMDSLSKSIFKMSLYQQVSNNFTNTPIRTMSLAKELQQNYRNNVQKTKPKPVDDSIFENVFGKNEINMILDFDNNTGRKKKSNQQSSIVQVNCAEVNNTNPEHSIILTNNSDISCPQMDITVPNIPISLADYTIANIPVPLADFTISQDNITISSIPISIADISNSPDIPSSHVGVNNSKICYEEIFKNFELTPAIIKSLLALVSLDSKLDEQKSDCNKHGVLLKLISYWKNIIYPVNINIICPKTTPRKHAALAFCALLELNSSRMNLIQLIKKNDSNEIYHIEITEKLIQFLNLN